MTVALESAVRRHAALEVVKAVDLLVLLASLLSVFVMSAPAARVGGVAALLTLNIPLRTLLQLLLAMLAWHLAFRLTGAYQSNRFTATRNQVFAAARSAALGVVLLSVIALLSRTPLPGKVFFELWALVTPLEVLCRLVLRAILFSLRRHGRNLRTLLIVGADERAMKFATRVEESKELGYILLGFAAAGSAPVSLPAERVVTNIADLAHYLGSNVVDEVAVCLTLPRFYDEVLAVARICEEQGIMMRIHGDLFDKSLRVARVDKFAGERIFTVTADSVPVWAGVGKLLLDVIGSAVLIVLLAPLLLLAAIAVKFSSPGPILFKQERLGRNKRRFRVYKFRTMVVDAEQQLAALEDRNEAGGPVFKMRHDPRITPVGRILRKLSLDELPQLFNVLAGDMSLVGPRPLPVRDYSGFSEKWYLRRFSVRPGISCLWQISGRSEIGFDQWMELDMKYIDQWSLWLDVKILAKTIPAVVRGAGAY